MSERQVVAVPGGTSGERTPKVMLQKAPWPYDLVEAVQQLRYPLARIELEERDRGQGCHGLTLMVYPDNPDSYHPERHVNTVFLYPVPAASYNRESWEEWIWARIEETDGHERAEGFKFVIEGSEEFRRPFKPAHSDGWDPGVVRAVVSETVANTPNAGRLVEFPCGCGHIHTGRMGEHFKIVFTNPCGEEGCFCPLAGAT